MRILHKDFGRFGFPFRRIDRADGFGLVKCRHVNSMVPVSGTKHVFLGLGLCVRVSLFLLFFPNPVLVWDKRVGIPRFWRSARFGACDPTAWRWEWIDRPQSGWLGEKAMRGDDVTFGVGHDAWEGVRQVHPR